MLYFRKQSGFLSTVAVIATLISGAANAQSLRDSQGPAEFPPSTFTANQYVDSRGCVFVRAGIGGTIDWVPRVSRDRQQLCGFAPTRVAGATASAQRPNVPNPLDTPVAGLEARAPAMRPVPVEPAPVVATATPTVRPPAPVVTAPAPRVSLPTRRPDTIAIAPRPPVQVSPPSPRVIIEPAAAVAIAPRVLTRAEACAGLTGVQSHLIGQRTGQPIDCGGTPAPQVVAVARPTVQTPAPKVSRPRLNRAQACADIQATGRQYVSATTGLPIQCAPQSSGAFARLQADLTAPPRTYSNPLDNAPGSIFTPPRPQTAGSSPARYSNPLDRAPGSTTFAPSANPDIVSRARTSRSAQGGWAQALGQQPPPYSNPTGRGLPAPTVAQGYEHVWGDGRLNTQRGLRAIAQTQSPLAVANTARYATTPRAQIPQRSEHLSGHRYVQVGTFETRDRAQAIARSLRARGLPMRVGIFTQNGREMRLVLAGPFASDTQLQTALGTARGAGFSGAFTRR